MMQALDNIHDRPRRPARPASLRAMTLLEMLLTVAVLSMLTVMVTPMFSDDSRLRVLAASQILSSDIELAQVMTISMPNEPIVVRFDPDGKTYWLALEIDPETPILREDTGEPYVVEFGAGRARSALGVTFALEDMTNSMLAFDATGALIDFTLTPLIHLNCADHGVTLMIKPMTGTIVEMDLPAEGEPPKELEPPKGEEAPMAI